MPPLARPQIQHSFKKGKRMDSAPGPHSNTVSLLSKVTNRSSTVTLSVLFTHLSNLSFYCHSFIPVPCDSGQGRRFHIQNAPSRSRPFLWSHDPTCPMDQSHKCMLISPAWSLTSRSDSSSHKTSLLFWENNLLPPLTYV